MLCLWPISLWKAWKGRNLDKFAQRPSHIFCRTHCDVGSRTSSTNIGFWWASTWLARLLNVSLTILLTCKKWYPPAHHHELDKLNYFKWRHPVWGESALARINIDTTYEPKTCDPWRNHREAPQRCNLWKSHYPWCSKGLGLYILNSNHDLCGRSFVLSLITADSNSSLLCGGPSHFLYSLCQKLRLGLGRSTAEIIYISKSQIPHHPPETLKYWVPPMTYLWEIHRPPVDIEKLSIPCRSTHASCAFTDQPVACMTKNGLDTAPIQSSQILLQ